MPKGIYKHPPQCGFQKRHPQFNTGRTRFKKGYKMSKKIKIKIGKAHKGRKPNNWKGGKFKSAGYFRILKSNHPFADKKGYIQRSRYIMERHLGKYLKPEEVVHHINNIKTDDKIENLRIFKNQSEHRKFHLGQIK